jgi:hypothetical protein
MATAGEHIRHKCNDAVWWMPKFTLVTMITMFSKKKQTMLAAESSSGTCVFLHGAGKNECDLGETA